MAASCAVVSLSSMLALVSSSSDNAMGRFDRLKKVTSCFTPSSNTWNARRLEIGDEPAGLDRRP